MQHECIRIQSRTHKELDQSAQSRVYDTVCGVWLQLTSTEAKDLVKKMTPTQLKHELRVIRRTIAAGVHDGLPGAPSEGEEVH